ncbi:MAG: YdaS family helix-turn-helix protein [Pseudaminobacter sp.]
MEKQSALQRAVKLAGGQSALAAKIRRAQGHVYYWLHHAKAGVPADAAIDIEVALSGAITRHDLRPDLFGPTPSKQEERA